MTAPTSVAIGAGSAAALAEPPPRPAPPPPPSAPPAPPPAAPPPAAPGTISAATIEAAGAVGALGTRSRASEEIAVVQNQVLRTMRAATTEGGRNPRLILVTSALPGEGKTFTSLNLAAAIARMSPQPVLLVDADGKPGSVSELLGCGRLDGLRGLAQRPGAPVQPLVVPTEFERLSFLPYGRPVEGMPPVPSAPSIAGALLRVAEALPRHVLIIDSPPALSTSEATTLAPIVGQVLVVVRAETTQRNEVEAALDMLDACPTLQLVLNQARVSSSDSFGVYGYEAYEVYPRP